MGSIGNCCCSECCCVREVDLVYPGVLATRIPVSNVDRYSTEEGEYTIEHCVYKPTEYLTFGQVQYLADVVLFLRQFERLAYRTFNSPTAIAIRDIGENFGLNAYVIYDLEMEIQTRSDGLQRIKLRTANQIIFLAGKVDGWNTRMIGGAGCPLISDITIPAFDGWNPIYIPAKLEELFTCMSFPDGWTFSDPIFSRSRIQNIEFTTDWQASECEIREASIAYDLEEYHLGSSLPGCSPTVPISITDSQSSNSSCYGFATTNTTVTFPDFADRQIFSKSLNLKVHYCDDPDTPLSL